LTSNLTLVLLVYANANYDFYVLADANYFEFPLPEHLKRMHYELQPFVHRDG
jgi:hypothetical protein